MQEELAQLKAVYAEWGKGNFWTPDIFAPDVEASSSAGDVFDHEVRHDPSAPRKIDATSSAGDVRISLRH